MVLGDSSVVFRGPVVFGFLVEFWGGLVYEFLPQSDPLHVGSLSSPPPL